MAVPLLRRLVADLLPQRPGFDSGSVNVGFVVDKVALGQAFPQSTSVFPCQFHSTGAPLQGERKELIIFITGLHNKPQGCGASVKSAAGPLTTKKCEILFLFSRIFECISGIPIWGGMLRFAPFSVAQVYISKAEILCRKEQYISEIYFAVCNTADKIRP
jgi:hypothetical protein